MLSYFHRFSVFVWTGENYSNALRVDAYFFENGEKLQISVCTRGRALVKRESESCYCKYESFEKIRYTVMVIELSGVQFGLKSYVHVISKSDKRARH